MKNSKLFILFFVLASLLLNACGTSCDIETYQEMVKPQIDKWQDAYQIANQTPRVSLASEIANLQEIKRDTESLEISECTIELHANLVQSMDFTIQGFLAFLGQDTDENVNYYFRQSDYYLEQYTKAIDEIKNPKK